MLTGCWSRTEINDVAIVLGVALDKGENENIRLALQIAKPLALGSAGSNQSSGESTLMISAEGENIMEVYRIIQEKLSRKIFFGHSRVIIIGEELARDGISPILDFFSRYRESHLRYFILFTKDNAIDILKSNPRLEPIMAEEIREQEKSGVGVKIRIRDFLKMMLTEGEEPVAAQISNLPLEEKSVNETEGSLSTKKVPAINGAAVFKGDQLIGWLDGQEARGILWFRNQLESGVISVNMSEKNGGRKVSAIILRASTKIKPLFRNDKLKIKIEANGEVEVYDNATPLDLSDPKTINTLKKEFEKDVKARLQLTLNKAQKELKSDIFGFGQAVYRTEPKKWENLYKDKWSEVFPDIEVEITPHIKIKGTGYNTKSLSITDKK